MNEVLGRLGGSLRRSWDEGMRIERIAFVVGALLVASGLVHLVALIVSGGTWTGPVSLRKPTTFGLSFGLTLATVAWVTHFIQLTPRWRRVLLTVFTVACVVETTLVSVQAWRGVPSHFNFSTGLNAAISGTLAFGGMVIVATAIAITMSTFRAVAQATPSMRLALRFGFVTLLVALGVGAAMIATGTTAAQSNPNLAYTTAGFLKPAHAVFIHAVLVIPGLAWLLTFTRWPERFRLRVVQLGAGGYLLVGVVVLVESITRVPPLAAPLPAMLAAGAGAALLLAAGGIGIYGVLLRRPDRSDTTPEAIRPTQRLGQIN